MTVTAIDVAPELLARIDAVPQLAGRTAVRELPGGLTNRNLVVTTPNGDMVARLWSAGSLLAIDRDQEWANSGAAAMSGAAPAAIAYAPDVAVLVVRFVAGRTWTSDDVLAPANARRIMRACRRLHSGPPFAGRFDMFDLQKRFRGLVRRHGFRLPPRYDDYAAHVSATAAALAVRQVPAVPCHNDLLAANVVDSEDRLWLIDFEYGGANDPFFEIGNVWSEAVGTPDDLSRLVEAYVGRRSDALTARARLWGAMSAYGWTLWAAVQDGSSDLDVDFWSWGLEKYRRAVAEFEDVQFGSLLAAARGGD